MFSATVAFDGGTEETPNAVFNVSKDPKPTAVKKADMTTRGWKPAVVGHFYGR